MTEKSLQMAEKKFGNSCFSANHFVTCERFHRYTFKPIKSNQNVKKN